MANQTGGDPQKLLDTAVQFSNKAQDVIGIMNALGNVAKTSIAPYLNRAHSSFDYLWAAWYDELLGISKAIEAMGLALGSAAMGLLATDGQNPTDAEQKDIATLKEQFSQFKSQFAAYTAAATSLENHGKSLDPNNPNASGTGSTSSNNSPPPNNSPSSNNSPPPKPDGVPIPGSNDPIVGVMPGDGTGLKIHQDSKGNKYVMNPGVQWISPGTPIRSVVTVPAPSGQPFTPDSSKDQVVGTDLQGNKVYQDKNGNWYYPSNAPAGKGGGAKIIPIGTTVTQSGGTA